MEIAVSQFRILSDNDLDTLLAKEGSIIITNHRRPRFVVSRYDSVKPQLEVKRELPEGGHLPDTSLEKREKEEFI